LTAAPGSLLSVSDLSLAEISDLLSMACVLETEAPAARAQRLFKRRVALLFYESSTRTRTSFELAAKSLGADTALISSKSSSIEKGESLKDTGLTLRALGAEAIILRHPSSGAAHQLAGFTGLPVLNAGDGMHEHPSQALLDLRTILSHLVANNKDKTPAAGNITDQSLCGITITICGDILHSRVARSNALLLPRLGAHVIFCGPEPLLPEIAAQIADGLGPGKVSIERDFDRALDQSHIVMMLRIQAERLAGLHLDLDEYKAHYQAGVERIGRHPKMIVMHPGPSFAGLRSQARSPTVRSRSSRSRSGTGSPSAWRWLHAPSASLSPSVSPASSSSCRPASSCKASTNSKPASLTRLS